MRTESQIRIIDRLARELKIGDGTLLDLARIIAPEAATIDELTRLQADGLIGALAALRAQELVGV